MRASAPSLVSGASTAKLGAFPGPNSAIGNARCILLLATFGGRAATDDPESTLRVASRPMNRGDRRTNPTPTLTVEPSTPHLAGSRQAFRGKAFAAARTGAKAKVRLLLDAR